MAEFSLLGFAAFLSGMVAKTDAIQGSQMERACAIVETEAKSAIGTDRYGWVALAPATVAKKGHDRPLEESGEMRDSIEHTVHHQGFLGTRIEGEVGSNLDRAVYNELGTSRAPPRSFLAEAARHKEAEVVHILGKGAIAPLLTGRGTL